MGSLAFKTQEKRERLKVSNNAMCGEHGVVSRFVLKIGWKNVDNQGQLFKQLGFLVTESVNSLPDTHFFPPFQALIPWVELCIAKDCIPWHSLHILVGPNKNVCCCRVLGMPHNACLGALCLKQ